MKATKEQFNELIVWIKESEDQNDFCERSILVDAIMLLSKEKPDTETALQRLFELTPIDGSKLVRPPDFATEIEDGKL